MIPSSFCKVVYAERNGMIELILSNHASSLTLDKLVVKVDEVERQTSIDFFSGFEDNIENQLESAVDIGKRNFN